MPATAASAASLGTERQGSAIVIGGDGLLVTAAYLVLHARDITLYFQSGEAVPASVIAHDIASGLALLRADLPNGTLALEIGTASAAIVGQRLLAVDYRGRTAAGAVELVSRAPFSGAAEYFLADALRTTPVRQHFSGAALIDRESRLLGIGAYGVASVEDNAPRSPAGNLFIPIDELIDVMGELLIHGHSSASERPWLGLSVDADLLVVGTDPAGPSRYADIRPGDEIIAIDNQRVRRRDQLYQKLWNNTQIGQSVPLLLARDDQLITVSVRTINAQEQTKCKAC